MNKSHEAMHPQAPIDRLLFLSGFFAAEVLRNPLLSEAKRWRYPTLYRNARATLLKQATLAALELTGPKQLRLWLCDCAAAALPLYEEVYPTDARSSQALQIARAFVEGRATSKELLAARQEAGSAEQDSWDSTFLEEQCPGVLDYTSLASARLEAANLAAVAAHCATLPEDCFLERAPQTEPIITGPESAAEALALQASFFHAKKERLSTTMLSHRRAIHQLAYAEKQTLRLIRMLGRQGEPFALLVELSLFYRQELHPVYQSKEQNAPLQVLLCKEAN